LQHFAFPHRARCGSCCCSRRMPGIAPTGYQAIRLVDRHRLRDFVPWTAAGRSPRDFGGKNISGSLQYIKKAPRRSIVGGGGHPGGPPHPPRGERLPHSVGVAAHSEYFLTKRSSFENLASNRESFAYPRAEGPRPQPNESEPDANMLDQIYRHELAWRIPRVES
jgi:hypothetical protein